MPKNVFIAALLAIAPLYAYAQDDLVRLPLHNPASGMPYSVEVPAECLDGSALIYQLTLSQPRSDIVALLHLAACQARMQAEQLRLLRDLHAVYIGTEDQ